MDIPTLIIALATAGYFLVTIFILKNMSKTLKASKSQVMLLEKQMLMTFRPRLELGIISWVIPPPKVEETEVTSRIEIDLRNIGNAPIQVQNPYLTMSFNIGGQERESWGRSSDMLKHELATFEINQNGTLVFAVAISRTVWELVTNKFVQPYCTVSIQMDASWELEPTPKVFTRVIYVTLMSIDEKTGEAKLSLRSIESKSPLTMEGDWKHYMEQLAAARKKYKNRKKC